MRIYRDYEYTQYLMALSNYRQTVIEKKNENKTELKVEKVGNIIDIQA